MIKRKDMSRKTSRTIIAALAIALLIAMAYSAFAHDPERPDLDHWYMSLHSKHGTPCCDISDAHAVAVDDWKTEDGHYKVKIDNNWQDVPDEAVIDAPNLAGKALVWFGYKSTKINCFMAGPMT